MKKIILTVITVLCVVNLQAQFEKGGKWIGGSFNFNIAGTKNNNTIFYKNDRQSVDLSISYNYFKTEKLINHYFIGFSYDGSLYTTSDTVRYDSKGMTYKLGFGKTHLYPIITNKLYTTINYNFYGDYRHLTNQQEFNTNSKSNSFSANANINLGLLYSLTERFAITTSLNNFLYASIYTATTKNYYNNIDYSNTTFGINGGLGLSGFSLGNLQFGLMYRLKGTK